MNISLIGLLAGVGLIVLLAGYAGWLWWRVWRQQSDARQRQANAQADQRESVRVLARALLEDGLNPSEAAIRLKVMLDYLLPNAGGQHYPAIYALHEATAHMPRRLARGQLSPAELQRLDAERERLEHRHLDGLHAEARQLLREYS